MDVYKCEHVLYVIYEVLNIKSKFFYYNDILFSYIDKVK